MFMLLTLRNFITTTIKLIRFSSWWTKVPLSPPDPIFGITDAHNKDDNPLKMNLGVGAYRDNDGNPYVLPSVRQAECIMSGKNQNKEYPPIDGYPNFRKLAIELALGDDNPAIKDGRTITIQTISGTGAVYIGAKFLNKYAPCKLVYISEPTWPNHYDIFKDNGFTFKHYTYYEPKTCSLNFEGLIKDISEMPEKSIILFHACAHNPTGVDPKPEQWAEITKVLKCKSIMPIFDMAYQGFATGDIIQDAYAVRLCIKEGIEIGLCQSFSKNMGLYGERVGTFTLVINDPKYAANIHSQIKAYTRCMFSTPPIHGPRIVEEILGNCELKEQWLEEVKGMAQRINDMRKLLKDNLIKLGSSRNWNHITDQIGMFCYTGLNSSQVKKLIKDYSIYLASNGRISVSGINTKNAEYLAKAMHEVTK